MKKEYKVEIIKEGALSTLLFGSSKLPLQKMTDVLNTYGRDGWDVLSANRKASFVIVLE